MSLLGRIYLLIAALIFVVLASWALWILRENATTVDLRVVLPHLDPTSPSVYRSMQVSVATLLAGWLVGAGVVGLVIARAPFRIRSAARRLRRIRELEREVQQLRTLPLRQHEEDELLAEEARLEIQERKVMTQSGIPAEMSGLEVDDQDPEDDSAQPSIPRAIQTRSANAKGRGAGRELAPASRVRTRLLPRPFGGGKR